MRADLAFSAGGSDGPASALRDGLESRISFTLRFYQSRPGIAGIFGDTLLAERTVVRAAFYDFFERRFVVEQDGVRTSLADEAGFLAAFFTLHGIELAPAAGSRAAAGLGGGASRYVDETFRPSANNLLSAARVLSLMRMDVKAPAWREGIELLRQSVETRKGKRYLRVTVRASRQHDPVPIRLDAAACWPTEEVDQA